MFLLQYRSTLLYSLQRNIKKNIYIACSKEVHKIKKGISERLDTSYQNVSSKKGFAINKYKLHENHDKVR